MSTVVETASVAPRRRAAPAGPRSGWRVARALAIVEGRRLLRQPMVLIGAVVGVPLFLALTWERAPILHRDDAFAAAALMPLAAMTLIAANLATSRSRRHRTNELYEATATSSSRRTIGHLLSLGSPVLLASGLVVAAMLYLASHGSVGAPHPVELLVGPAAVALFGAIGVLLARWAPSAVAGPLAVVAIAAIHVAVWDRSRGGAAKWLLPYVPPGNVGNAPPELVIRPIGWHVIFLLGLTLAVAAIAMLRSGNRLRPLALAGAAVALTLVAAGAQARAPSHGQRLALAALVRHPHSVQECEVRHQVRYCAFPAYMPWIDHWDAAISQVLHRVPPRFRPRNLVVRQVPTSSEVYDGLPADMAARVSDRLFKSGWPSKSRAIHPGMNWGRGEAEGRSQLALALEAAAEAVGLPRRRHDLTSTGANSAETPYSCLALGQARSVVALWLAGQATPDAEEALRRVVTEEPYGVHVERTDGVLAVGGGDPYQWSLSNFAMEFLAAQPVTTWGREEANYAVSLLDRPDSAVAARMRENWRRLTAPKTPTKVLVKLFGLERLPTPRQQLLRAGLDPDDHPLFLRQTVFHGAPPCR